MKEQYISLETAKLAKEKKVHIEGCCEVYSQEGGAARTPNGGKWNWEEYDKSEFCLRPTQSLLARYLREIRKVNVTVKFRKDIYKYFYEVENIQILEDGFVSSKTHFSKYEDAKEAGLQCALNHLRW